MSFFKKTENSMTLSVIQISSLLLLEKLILYGHKDENNALRHINKCHRMFFMRILIFYYSKTGNTEAISYAIKKTLEPNCEVDIVKIEMENEYSNLLTHLNPRIILDIFLNRKPKIKPLIDISPYDFFLVGTPNWYGRMAPPINTFIDSINVAEGKKAIIFVSSGFGKESYTDDLKNRLEEKGVKVLKTLSLKLSEISESQKNEIKEILTY
jgi:flavodoxin